MHSTNWNGVSNPTLNLTVIILTYNEEKHIQRCISCIKLIAKEIFVIDSFSTDKTCEIARAQGASVLQNQFLNQAKQFQWALDHVPTASEWVMRLDADEVIEPDLIAEIADKLPFLPSTVTGINLKRKHIFMGRWIRHGGRYPLVLLRIWRRGVGRIEDRWMDEHIFVERGRTVTFDGGFADHNLSDLSAFTDKHNKYATREAIDVLNKKYKLLECDNVLSRRGVSFQAFAKRTIKQVVYNRLPYWLGPCAYFLHRYLLKLGFLDGPEGFLYHFLQGFWYRVLVGGRVAELDKVIAPLPDNSSRLTVLAGLTGHKLGDGS